VSGCFTSWSNIPMTPADHGNDPLPPRVVEALRCSVCASPLEGVERTLRCASGHSFDLARQGYVKVLHARIPAGTADTAPMVAARADFLASGAYRPLADELARVCAEAGDLVIDAGAGTGYYLAHVLEAAPAAFGLALDVSAVALRRAARAHARLGAAVWNLWEPWPVGDETASVVLNVFAPRNVDEIRRVLRPGGPQYASTVGQLHLREIYDLAHRFDPRIAAWGGYTTHSFRLENGFEQLSGWFSTVVLHRYEDSLIVTQAAPLAAFIASEDADGILAGDRHVELARFVEQELKLNGAIHITKDSGLFEAC